MTLSIRASALVFEDPQSEKLLKRIKQVAPSEANVLIIGETGTGKELIARHIHSISDRKNEQFVAINCGSLSESLVESELFGHEKGAFTGAHAVKQGWFETASGGTLFLDEIGDLPLAMQVKLLRVLQEREVVRVGSRLPIPINVRLIAATNVNLEEAVLAGRFREDLYYRLSVAVLNLPPLRLRPGDILPLARYFLASYGRRLGCPDKTFSAEAETLMFSHYWPGNIRELENAVHHAVLVSATQEVAAEDFKLSTLNTRPAASDNPQTGFDDLQPLFAELCKQQPERLALRVEQMLLKAAYEACNYNQLAAARLLGLSRHVVRAKLIAHDIIPANSKAQVGISTTTPPPPTGDKLLLFPFKVKLQHTDFTGIDTLPAEACAEVWGF
ncbi:sigma-54 interaction domain-containing protein [Methylomonas sp. 2BW1-5-20]|uniref:sigma-54 interaction domain-containing protein n=1 Tax=Methylomonas sp. 2BW1-5-20 TaxID=3376686 RepID=UPI004050812A